ncbi:hypothetical protein JZ751_028975 [Albula glossodonta]|uniref:Uncharacterized protein n=1 Tax=Albula glossodonta TaxID=121402 RepID=A0A8T2PGP4_9TELE|nr:hypothetical protein JZ751_028975 [Albula glossodonta]
MLRAAVPVWRSPNYGEYLDHSAAIVSLLSSGIFLEESLNLIHHLTWHRMAEKSPDNVLNRNTPSLGYEDWLRHKADNAINQCPVHVIQHGKVVRKQSRKLRVSLTPDQ